MITHICLWCKEEFIAIRVNHFFCCKSHNQKFRYYEDIKKTHEKINSYYHRHAGLSNNLNEIQKKMDAVELLNHVRNKFGIR